MSLPELRKQAEEITDSARIEKTQLQRLEKFNKLLNREVDETKLKPHPVAKEARYLPISVMEMALDIAFFGLWKTENFRWSVIVNEITGAIDLHVYHPIKKEWIVRTGAGAQQIMMDKIPDDMKKTMTKQDINQWYLDMQNKKPAALDMGGFAALKAMCFKNACLSLGKYFGRDVNREYTDQFREFITEADEKVKKLRKELSEALEHCQDKELVNEIIADITKHEEEGTNTPAEYRKCLNKLNKS